MAFAYSPKIVTDGLVLYLDAANPYSYVSGSTMWNDISRSQLSGSLINGPIFNNNNGGSIVFDGVNDYVTFGNIFNDVMAGTGKQFTYNCTFTPTSTLTQVLFGKYADANTLVDERQFAVFVRDVGFGFKIDIIFTTNPLGFVNVVRSDTTLNLNTPYTICITYDDTQPTSLQKIGIWVNGIQSNTTLANSGQFGPITTGSAQFGIGASIASTGLTTYRYTGRVSTLSLYSKQLTPQEIIQNYNSTKTRFGL